MADLWYTEIESKIFTIVKTRMLKKYKTKYPKMEFVSDDENRVPTGTPTIYLRELNSPEMANTLLNNSIGMVQENIEIEVYTLTSKLDCRKVSAYAIGEMKALAFSVIQQSPPMMDGDWWRCVLRFTRPIGSGDVLK